MGVMSVAILSTKVPILLGHGFWGFSLPNLPYYGFWGMAHEARTGFRNVLRAALPTRVGWGAMVRGCKIGPAIHGALKGKDSECGFS